MKLTDNERMWIKNHVLAYSIGLVLQEGKKVTYENIIETIDENEDEVFDMVLSFKAYKYPKKEMDKDHFCEFSYVICEDKFGVETMKKIIDEMENFREQ